MKKAKIKKIFIILLPFIAVVLTVLALLFFKKENIGLVNPDPLNIILTHNLPTKMGGDFTLVNHLNQKQRLSDLSGKPSLLYFGFTHCPDYCPSALQSFDAIDGYLGGDKINRLFISVDPNRDKVSILKDYVSLYKKGLIAMTGTKDQIKSITKDWKVFYSVRQKNKEDMDYTVDHVTYYFLTDKNGDLVALIKPEGLPKDIAEFIKKNYL